MQVYLSQLKEKDIMSYNLVKASWLQKACRRGLTETALAIGQLYLDENQKEGLRRKLLVFCFEDVGLGSPDLILRLNKTENLLDQIKLICDANKNREVDRFLLAVRDFYPQLRRNPEIRDEVETMNIVFEAADRWFNNKRLKANLKVLEDIINVLKEEQSELNKKIIDATFEAYKLLSKHNSFGARTTLSFITLLSLRKFKVEEQEIVLNDKVARPIDLVDDFALDKHTAFGRILNRGDDFWYATGSVISNEVFYPELYLKNGKEKYPYTLWKEDKNE